ncbi:MAG: hypothetical protein JW934_01460 [Anaerolineae bacterium]|nr:hypothetical protein [Anaerolineae bacterium]
MDRDGSRNEMVWVAVGVTILVMTCLCVVAFGAFFFFGVSPLLFFMRP